MCFQLSNILSFYFLINSFFYAFFNFCSFLYGLTFIFLDCVIIPVSSVYVWHFVQFLDSLIYRYMFFLISVFY